MCVGVVTISPGGNPALSMDVAISSSRNPAPSVYVITSSRSGPTYVHVSPSGNQPQALLHGHLPIQEPGPDVLSTHAVHDSASQCGRRPL